MNDIVDIEKKLGMFSRVVIIGHSVSLNETSFCVICVVFIIRYELVGLPP